MEKAHIVGFRAHPDFTTLIQTVYECGHVYSQELSRFNMPHDTDIRCTKCLTGVPAEVTGDEFTAVCHQSLLDHPMIRRLARSLLFHFNLSEKRQYLDQERRQELEFAIEEARHLLEEIGLGFDPMGTVESEHGDIKQQHGPGSTNSNPTGGYYYELPDLSII